jgi:hypothetical protein
VDIRPHRARVKSPQRRWRLNSFTSSPPARAPMRCVGLSTVALKTAALAAHAALRQAMIFVGLYTLDFGRRGLLPHERPGRTTFAPNPKRLASSKRSSIVCAQRLSRLKLRRISRQPAPLSNRPRRSTKTTGVNGRLLSRAGICYRLADGRSEGGELPRNLDSWEAHQNRGLQRDASGDHIGAAEDFAHAIVGPAEPAPALPSWPSGPTTGKGLWHSSRPAWNCGSDQPHPAQSSGLCLTEES